MENPNQQINQQHIVKHHGSRGKLIVRARGPKVCVILSLLKRVGKAEKQLLGHINNTAATII